MVIKEQGLTILTDPGSFTVQQQESVTGIDVILITHEHTDHIHLESLKKIIAQNSKAKIITNNGVAKLLDAEQITYTLITHGQHITINNVLIEGFGEHHAEIYKTVPRVENTGYMVADTFFYPGDALTVPSKPVEILALPVAGPWLKTSEAVDYALAVNPKKYFLVHDAVTAHGVYQMFTSMLLKDSGILYVDIQLGVDTEL